MTDVDHRTPAPGSRVDRSPLDETDRLALEQALRAGIRGDVSFDNGTRAVYATDSSNYRQVPLGVIFPRDTADVVAAVKICGQFDAPILGRGGGTSLAGQGCNVAVVMDFSRHMNKILEIDPERRIARIQPGLVLDDLRAETEKLGLTFGPDPATHAWCTLGGMIGNNSCGTHALYAGKTVDNIERLSVVTYSGEMFDLGSYTDNEYAKVVADGGRLAEILGGLREVGRRHADLVAERFPDIPRRVSGYNLDQLVPTSDFHIARSLVGSESTCVIVTEAVVRLMPSPAHRRLVVLGYPDIYLAADAVPSLLAQHPLLGLEGFDDTLVRQMRARNLNTEYLPMLPDGGGWLLAEVGHDDPVIADQLAADVVASLPSDVDSRRYDDPVQQRAVWVIRESGLGATAHPIDGPPNHEGWEDAAVDPKHLGTYLRGIAELWKKYGYSGAWYGHFGQGCVHTRNNFELHTADGLKAFRSFVEEAADLVGSLGGSISGEHGDGQARGELLERMYGPELIDAFRQMKSIWDPRGRMNPGKLVDPFPLDTNLKHGPDYLKSTLDTETFYLFSEDKGSLQLAADRCVGVGRCRRDDTGVMCPSYRATRDERHSTRGRAKMLVEMFRGEVTKEDWRNDDVHEALELCLACKGCSVDCPTHVDMATYKSEFMAHYYEGRMRPRAMYTLGFIPWASKLATRMPGLANRALSTPVLGNLIKRGGGITTNRPAPTFSKLSLRRSRNARRRQKRLDATVVVWPDTFTDAFNPKFGADTIRVLEAVGEKVAIPKEWACCGRPLYDTGMLNVAKSALKHLLDVLEPYIDAGLPIIVPEPSCLAAFRDELPALMSDDPRAARLAAMARSLSEHLLAEDLLPELDPTGRRAVVHPHCHGRAAVGTIPDQTVLRRLGYTPHMLDAGCCGLAGSFGFNADHEPLSRTIGEEQWLPKLRQATGEDDVLIMDGFSCITQLDQLDGRPSHTLAQLILSSLPAT